MPHLHLGPKSAAKVGENCKQALFLSGRQWPTVCGLRFIRKKGAVRDGSRDSLSRSVYLSQSLSLCRMHFALPHSVEMISCDSDADRIGCVGVRIEFITLRGRVLSLTQFRSDWIRSVIFAHFYVLECCHFWANNYVKNDWRTVGDRRNGVGGVERVKVCIYVCVCNSNSNPIWKSIRIAIQLRLKSLRIELWFGFWFWFWSVACSKSSFSVNSNSNGIPSHRPPKPLGWGVRGIPNEKWCGGILIK